MATHHDENDYDNKAIAFSSAPKTMAREESLDSRLHDDKVNPEHRNHDFSMARHGNATQALPLDHETSSSMADNPMVKRALHFLATASSGTLAGVALGFAAVTYVLLGRIGLVLIGAFGGIVSFVAWEARNPGVSRAVRGETGPDVLQRLWLELKDAQALNTPLSADKEEDDYVLKTFEDFRPETREALGGLVDAVIRDYVKWWYNPIVPSDHSFPLSCRKTLTSYLLTISNRLYRKRPADAFLDLLTNASSIVIVFMAELATAFADLPLDSNVNAMDAVYNYLATNPDSRLASLLGQKQHHAKFKVVAEDLLGFLDRNTYSCDPARVFLREIFANSILETVLQTCSKPEWINGWIVYLLEAGEPDLSHAIDVAMQSDREASNAAFGDMDGNMGNVGVAKASRSSIELDKGRRKESSSHKKKLSKADEELEEAMEEVKRMNARTTKDRHTEEQDSTSNSQGLQRASVEKTSVSNTSVSEDDRPTPATTPMDESPTTTGSNSRFSPRGTSADGFSTKSEVAVTPLTPQSIKDSDSRSSSPTRSNGARFTSFDQIVPQTSEDDNDEGVLERRALTLHNASFTLHDDMMGEKGKIRGKPNWDYLIQVEPTVAGHSGWMIVRRYSDFETLHEILRRIATITGATAFTELHKELPSWKIHTRESLRGELERYVRDACWYQSLAESEGMKRFLEKSQGHTYGASKGFGWETVGKNMLDVLSTAPKGAIGGGKTIVGGVSNVFGNFPGLGRKATNHSIDLTTTPSSSRLPITTPQPPPPPPQMEQSKSPVRSERTSIDSQQSSVIAIQPGKIAPMERRPSHQSLAGDMDMEQAKRGRLERMDSYVSITASGRASREHSRASSLAPARSPSAVSLDRLKLPPPPDEIPDDYGSTFSGGVGPSPIEGAAGQLSAHRASLSVGNLSVGSAKKVKPARNYSQLSEQETRVAVELLFAVINEMYTLSSAWNIRRTLLAAAKSFLLRPGNPSLLTVQSLIQSSVLDANTSDTGIAHHLRKLRENTMPTDDERATWPAEMTTDEKEKLATKARKMIIQRGVPAALMGVMGQAATGEALGRVFDCLQIEEVARGLVFGVMVQAIDIITH